MRTLVSLLLMLFTSLCIWSQDSTNADIGSINLKSIEGDSINTSDLLTEGPTLIIFWATWSAPDKRLLNTIHDEFEQWQKETGVKLVAVSIDDNRLESKVEEYVKSKSWSFLVLRDPDHVFMREMGVNTDPHTFLFDKDGAMVFSHAGYIPGDEKIIYKELLKLNSVGTVK